ncbi:MAG: permease for cytosine/purines uracil thiamine allantoin [Pseudonocardiales bacterium]|nr:permease for cytosine/purines uracil thiamine allantoin [Pseudonocardiales bacterium]
MLDSVICTALCFFVIFSGSFNHYYSEFLGLLVVWLAPWIAIYGVDWLLRRGRYDAAALVDDTRYGRYWRNGGVHLPGLIAQVVGMIAAALWINSAAYVGPLSKAVDGSDFSVFTGIIAAGVTYWVLAGRGVAKETALTAAATDEPIIEVVPVGFPTQIAESVAT